MDIKNFCLNRFCDVVVGVQGLGHRVQTLFVKQRPIYVRENEADERENAFDVEKGLKLHKPSAAIEWSMTAEALEDRFADAKLKKLVFGPRAGDYVLPVELQPGFECQLVFHFDPLGPGAIRSIDLVDGKRQVGESYTRFQEFLSQRLGDPLCVEQGDAGYQTYEWRMGRIQVLHYVVNQSGLKECVRFRLMKPGEFTLTRSA